MANFHENNPRNSYIQNRLWTLKDNSLPHLLQNHLWNHNFCRNLHMPSLLAQAQQSYKKASIYWETTNARAITLSFIKEPEAMVVILTNNKAFQTDGESRTFLYYWYTGFWGVVDWRERNCPSGLANSGRQLMTHGKHALCMQMTGQEPLFLLPLLYWLLHSRRQSSSGLIIPAPVPDQ